MSLADVKSGNKSFGHRFLSPQSFTIPESRLEGVCRASKKEARASADRNAGGLGSRGPQESLRTKTRVDEELAHMNAQLVEEPFFLSGTFSQEYLELPAEVLASCMKKKPEDLRLL